MPACKFNNVKWCKTKIWPEIWMFKYQALVKKLQRPPRPKYECRWRMGWAHWAPHLYLFQGWNRKNCHNTAWKAFFIRAVWRSFLSQGVKNISGCQIKQIHFIIDSLFYKACISYISWQTTSSFDKTYIKHFLNPTFLVYPRLLYIFLFVCYSLLFIYY